MKNATVIMLVVCLAMAAPTFGAGWDGGGSGDDWSTLDNWSTNAVPTSSDNVDVDGAYSVEITSDVGSIGELDIMGGATVTMTGGALTITGEYMQIGDDGIGTFEISDGTLTATTDNGADALVLGNGVGDGTLKIIGSLATINVGGFKANNSSTATGVLSLVMADTTAGISPECKSTTSGESLVVHWPLTVFVGSSPSKPR